MLHSDSVAFVSLSPPTCPTCTMSLFFWMVLRFYLCLWFQTTTSWCGFSLTASCSGFAKVFFGDSRCGCWESEPDSSRGVPSAPNYWAISSALAEIFLICRFMFLKNWRGCQCQFFFTHFIFSFWNTYCVYVRLMNIVPRLCLHAFKIAFNHFPLFWKLPLIYFTSNS